MAKYMLPIIQPRAVAFLKSTLFSANYRNNALTFDTMEDVPNILWKSKDWMFDIFGIKKVYQYNVEAFFFQLLATGILSVDYEGNDGVRFLLTQVDKEKYLYSDVRAWKGFEFRNNKRTHNSVSYDDLVHGRQV